MEKPHLDRLCLCFKQCLTNGSDLITNKNSLSCRTRSTWRLNLLIKEKCGRLEAAFTPPMHSKKILHVRDENKKNKTKKRVKCGDNRPYIS